MASKEFFKNFFDEFKGTEKLINFSDLVQCMIKDDYTYSNEFEEKLDTFDRAYMNNPKVFFEEFGEYVDEKRFLLFNLYLFKSHLNEIMAGEDKIVRDFNVKYFYNKLLSYSKRYISPNDDVYFFDVVNKKKEIIIRGEINSDELIYGKKKSYSGFKLNEDLQIITSMVNTHDFHKFIPSFYTSFSIMNMIYSQSVDNLEDVRKNINGDSKNSSEIEKYFEKLKFKIFSNPIIQRRVNEDKMYIVSGYNLINKLRQLVEDDKSLDLNLQEMSDFLNFFVTMHDTIDKNAYIELDDKKYGLDELTKEVDEVMPLLAKNSLKDKKMLLPIFLAFDIVNMEDFKKYLDDTEEKVSSLTISYLLDKISYEDTMKLAEKYNISRELMKKYVYNSLRFDSNNEEQYVYKNVDELTDTIDFDILTSSACIEEDFKRLSYFLNDDEIYKLFFIEYKKNNITPKIKILSQLDSAKNEIINQIIFDNNNLDKLIDLFGKEKILEFYNVKEFAEVISKKVSNVEKDYETERKFLMNNNLYRYFNFIMDEERKYQLIEELGDNVLNEDVLKFLYKEQIITIKEIEGFAPEIIPDMFESNLLNNKDRNRFLLKQKQNLSLKELMILEKDGAFSREDAVRNYFTGRIDFNTLKAFVEDSDVRKAFSENEIINIIKKYVFTNKDEDKEKYEKYMKAYYEFVLKKEKDNSKFENKVLSSIKNLNNMEMLKKLYNDKVLSITTLENDTKFIVELIRSGEMKSKDARELFRDVSPEGEKYKKLIRIFSEFDISNDDKLNLISEVYGNSVDFLREKENLVMEYLDNTVYENQSFGKKEGLGEHHEKRILGEDTKRILTVGLADRYDFLSSLDENMKSKIYSGTYVANVKNKYIFEQLYKTSGRKNIDGEHATYLLDENLYAKMKSIIIAKNSKGEEYVDWSAIMEMKDIERTGYARVTHSTKESWQNGIRTKLGIVNDPTKKIEIINEKIENNSKSINR